MLLRQERLPWPPRRSTIGPVVSVTRFRDDGEALALANDTLYGLGAGVWSRDGNRAYRFGRAVQAGRVWTNRCHLYPAHAAFGGCCDGSSPMCYPLHEFRVGAQDTRLGTVAGTPFYIGAAQFEYWEHTQLIIDVVPGRGSGFSLEAPEGVRFLTRSRVFSGEELGLLRDDGPPARGDAAEGAA